MESVLSEKTYAKNNHGFNPWLFALKMAQTISTVQTYWMFEFAIQFS